MKTLFLSLAIISLLLYIIVGALLYFSQESVLYHPNKDISTLKKIKLKSGKEVINIIVLNGDNDKAIIYFGGNAESMVRSQDYISNQFPNYTIYLMDYRGYGESSGVPSEIKLKNDALVLFDKINSLHKSISAGGRSLGSGIAAYLASKRDLEKLVLITPYDSIYKVASDKYYMYPVSLLLKDHYDTTLLVKDINAPTLLILAELDTLIPYKRSKALINKFKAEKKKFEVKIIKNKNHVDISSSLDYHNAVIKFIKN